MLVACNSVFRTIRLAESCFRHAQYNITSQIQCKTLPFACLTRVSGFEKLYKTRAVKTNYKRTEKTFRRRAYGLQDRHTTALQRVCKTKLRVLWSGTGLQDAQWQLAGERTTQNGVVRGVAEVSYSRVICVWNCFRDLRNEYEGVFQFTGCVWGRNYFRLAKCAERVQVEKADGLWQPLVARQTCARFLSAIGQVARTAVTSLSRWVWASCQAQKTSGRCSATAAVMEIFHGAVTSVRTHAISSSESEMSSSSVKSTYSRYQWRITLTC
jgi:hypothetical protein